jgi:putative heme iron utilization protein
MDAEPGQRDPRFVILDGIRTEQRRQAATERLRQTDPDGAGGAPASATLVRQIEALEVMAAICAVQVRAAHAPEATGAVHRWHRLTALVEMELAAVRRQLDLVDPSGKTADG